MRGHKGHNTMKLSYSYFGSVRLILTIMCIAMYQLIFEEYNAAYILFVFEAEEFAAMVSDNTLHTHISATQAQYPGFIICYLVNKLKWYLNKK